MENLNTVLARDLKVGQKVFIAGHGFMEVKTVKIENRTVYISFGSNLNFVNELYQPLCIKE